MLNGLMKEKDEESYEITVIIAGTNSKSPIDISFPLKSADLAFFVH
tara:strand:- start:570 stop:707 length:138 start_codon:yes stop_codon:yes gene_type:complete